MLQNVNTTTETCYRRVTFKFTSLQQVTQYSRYIEQGRSQPRQNMLGLHIDSSNINKSWAARLSYLLK